MCPIPESRTCEVDLARLVGELPAEAVCHRDRERHGIVAKPGQLVTESASFTRSEYDRMMKLRQIFASNLRRIRLDRNLTQENLADMAGLDRTYVSALERQVYSASLDTIEKLAEVLTIEHHDLLKRE